MDKYEYKQMKVKVQESDAADVDSYTILYIELNKLGAEGWLLVSPIGYIRNEDRTGVYEAILTRKTK